MPGRAAKSRGRREHSTRGDNPMRMQLAGVGRSALPRRTVRLRLTALYGVLFLLSGIVLLAIPNSEGQSRYTSVRVASNGGGQASIDQLRLQEGAAVSHQFLVGSVIALGIMAVVSVVLGWMIAGRVLRPLREMTAAARRISEDNLHERLAVPGPGDELKDLADTIDGLLERLEGAFAAQRRFVANASHELRTPLATMRASLDVALTDPRPTLAAYQATCEDVLEASEQQEQLIEALLTLARSQRGLDRRQPVDLADITIDALHSREPDAAARGLAVSFSITAAPVLGDARLLQRLAANLIDNALRHNIPGGRLDVQVTACAGHATLKITNTGPDVPGGQATRLLQPFQRLSASRTASDEGLGLGLSIVAAIAKAHHATLTVNPGRRGGLDIEIIFPAAAAIAPARQRALATA